jgi:periplasmic protein TonB
MSAQLLNQALYRDMRKNSDVLLIWLFIAAVFHAIVLIGIGFDNPKPQVVSKTIEVTLVNSATKKAPENAKYFAQANQIAAGQEDQKPLPVAKKKPKTGHDRKKQQQTHAAKPQTVIEHRLITRKNAEKKLNSAEKQDDSQEKAESKQSQPELSMEELDKQIAQLEINLQQQKENAEKTRIKSINAISAHKYAAAHYIKDWEVKVQRIGNLNYPEINGKKDFSATLSMDVGVNTDGSIYNVVIVKSSGIPALDKAAEQIVRISSPFEPLPEAISKQLDVLMIRREWIFSNDGTISTSD